MATKLTEKTFKGVWVVKRMEGLVSLDGDVKAGRGKQRGYEDDPEALHQVEACGRDENFGLG